MTNFVGLPSASVESATMAAMTAPTKPEAHDDDDLQAVRARLRGEALEARVLGGVVFLRGERDLLAARAY